MQQHCPLGLGNSEKRGQKSDRQLHWLSEVRLMTWT